ncbi:MAG: GldG family protein [Bdellovibrionales bacterium]|nr:GldG family protein [Bdellovibrionales bacterium]
MKKLMKNLPVLFSVLGFLLLGILFSNILLPELPWVSIALAVVVLGILGALLFENRQALKSRQAAFGLNSAITTLLVISIVGVVNFLGARYPFKWDTTRNKINTLSEQTLKVVRDLKTEVKIVYYAKVGIPTPGKDLLERYKALSTKFVVEWVDPLKEPSRARAAGIRREGTAQIMITQPGEAGKPEKVKTEKLEELTEEKLTNTLIRLSKEKIQHVCATTGHGEKSFTSTEQDGYDAVKKIMAGQNYEVKDLAVKDGKISNDDCEVLVMVGPTRSFFPAEVKALSDYLDAGGRLLVAGDIEPKGSETMPEISALLATWFIKFERNLIIDPISRLANMDPSIAMTQTYAKSHPIGKDMTIQTFFPFSRSVEIMAGAPPELKIEWLVRAMPTAWGETDFASLAKGQPKNDPKVDKGQPINLAVVLEGKKKDSKATRNTRIVALGSANIANNAFQRAGGNADLFVNSINWLMGDENLISIRTKEDGPAKFEMSQMTASIIFWITLIIAPLSICVAGIVIWIRRKRL